MSDTFRVWAPAARYVDLHVGVPGSARDVVAMERGRDGWWEASSPLESEGGLDYAYAIDGGEPRPDPRSPRQPAGVHGFSRTYDAASFPWTDGDWRGPRKGAGVKGAVLYELHVGTFTEDGTFAAAAARLDHLVRLGVDVVQLLPVAAFSGRWGWGYDGVDLYAVHEPYGGPAGLQAFVDACHRRGLGVCLDVVYNHLGPDGNYLAAFGPYFTDRHVTPWGPAVNLDGEDAGEVRRFVVDNALRWFDDFHVDALRLDAVHELRDDSPRHLLAQLSDEVGDLSAGLGRPLDLIAESDLNDPVMVTPTAEGGRGMSAQWADDVHHALHVALTGERQGYYADFADPGALPKTLGRVFLHDGSWSSFRHSTWGAPVDPERHRGGAFVGYLQTHDQVGNRATGDRISATVAPGAQAGAAALYLLGAFTPMVFMGEEWAASTPWRFFSDFADDDLAEAVRSGRRAEFAAHGWAAEDVPDPQDPATREASVLDWSEPGRDRHRRMLHWYRALIAARRREPSFTDDVLDDVDVQGEGDRVLLRRGRFVVAAALGDRPATFALPAAGGEVELAFDPSAVRLDGRDLHLRPHACAVVRLSPASAGPSR